MTKLLVLLNIIILRLSIAKLINRSKQDLIMKHLEDNNVSYTHHWKRAMKMSIVLFIHAWIPNCLEYYASEQLKN